MGKFNWKIIAIVGIIAIILAFGAFLMLQKGRSGTETTTDVAVAVEATGGERVINGVVVEVATDPNAAYSITVPQSAEDITLGFPSGQTDVEKAVEPTSVPPEVAAVLPTPTPIPSAPPPNTPVPNVTAGGINKVAHTVVAGDTLYGIALKYGSSVVLMAENDIASGDLIPGNVIQVPVQSNVGSGGTACTTGRSHIVSAGENVFRLAIYYGTTVNGISATNGLDAAHTIYAGQVLCIP